MVLPLPPAPDSVAKVSPNQAHEIAPVIMQTVAER
jgi:hypothetical protein